MRKPTITSPYTESEFNELLAEYNQKQKRANNNIFCLCLGCVICILTLSIVSTLHNISGNLILALGIAASVFFGLVMLIDKNKKRMPVVIISHEDDREIYKLIHCTKDKAAAQFALQVYQQNREFTLDEFQLLCMHLSAIQQVQNYETQLHNLQSIVDGEFQ